MPQLLIKNALVLDGTGAEPFLADIAVDHGIIRAVGSFPHAVADRIIDAKGRCVTPGFMDIHRHGDAACLREGFGEADLRQGVTYIVNGNCGLSVVPSFGLHSRAILDYLSPVTGRVERPWATLSEYRNAVRIPIHHGMLAGLGTIRAVTAGYAAGKLDADQMTSIHRLLEQTLSDGALGVSLGLGYAPDCFFSPEELLTALAPVAGTGIPVTVHVRSEGDGLLESLEEMVQAARVLRTPVHISHLKSIGKRNWNRHIPTALEMLERGRQEGLSLTCDVYPYTAGSTQLTHILPPEYLLGGTEAICRRLKDEAARENLRERLETGSDFENIVLLAGWENIYDYGLTEEMDKPYEGMSIRDAAALAGKEPLAFVCDLLAAEHCGVTMIDFIASEEDLIQILHDPFSSVISDSTYPSQGQLHPRVFGTFPRILERYVREQQVLTLPEAIRKMTSLPAQTLGIPNKGKIAPGYDADLNVFDLSKIHEPGTYADSQRFAQGMDWVLVNGVP